MTHLVKGKRSALAVGIVGVVVVGWLDHVTGEEIRLFPLYFLPVALVAWRVSKRATALVSVLSAAAWFLSNWLAGDTYRSLWVWPVNVLSQLIAFGTVGGLVAAMAERLAAERRAGRHDPLTGLLNRRAFYEATSGLLALCRRNGRPFTIVYVDLDHFKSVNDGWGHEAGDRALTTAAELFRTNLRESDVLARLGGDEFAIAMPETNAKDAGLTLDRLRERTAEAMAAAGWPVTTSIGATSYAAAPSSLEAALKRADETMYRAKTAGKNHVIVEEESDS